MIASFLLTLCVGANAAEPTPPSTPAGDEPQAGVDEPQAALKAWNEFVRHFAASSEAHLAQALAPAVGDEVRGWGKELGIALEVETTSLWKITGGQVHLITEDDASPDPVIQDDGASQELPGLGIVRVFRLFYLGRQDVVHQIPMTWLAQCPSLLAPTITVSVRHPLQAPIDCVHINADFSDIVASLADAGKFDFAIRDAEHPLTLTMKLHNKPIWLCLNEVARLCDWEIQLYDSSGGTATTSEESIDATLLPSDTDPSQALAALHKRLIDVVARMRSCTVSLRPHPGIGGH